MNGISTHVLDTTTGMPIPGIAVKLLRAGVVIGSGITTQDGRISDFSVQEEFLCPGTYQLTFNTGTYFSETFYPEVSITFMVRDNKSRYHIPLLLSPFGYTTYRGS